MKSGQKKYRLLTRSDLDGLICAVLMKHLDLVSHIELLDHPSVMQEGGFQVSDEDISTNLPYVEGIHLAFDHHVSETLRNKENPRHIIDPNAPSAARVIYEYYGGKRAFPDLFDDMMVAVDKADSGNFNKEEILYPRQWALLNFLVDKRTGIEEWGKFALSEERFKLNLIDWIGKMTIQELMAVPDVRQRADIYFQYEDLYKEQLISAAAIHQNIITLDFRNQKSMYPGNRFVVYALYPDCNVSILIRLEPDREKTTFSVGKSIINTSSTANVGQLMLEYGGGGHKAAGACHVDNAVADRVLAQLIEKLTDTTAASH